MLEEKYLTLLSQYNRELRNDQEQKSVQMTLFNSEIKLPSISIAPSYVVRENLDTGTLIP